MVRDRIKSKPGIEVPTVRTTIGEYPAANRVSVRRTKTDVVQSVSSELLAKYERTVASHTGLRQLAESDLSFKVMSHVADKANRSAGCIPPTWRLLSQSIAC
jgi:hypothetical protein